jgi:hypothetical protein
MPARKDYIIETVYPKTRKGTYIINITSADNIESSVN